VGDGPLSASVLAAGWAVTGVTTAVCLPAVKEEKIPETAVFTACFFVASTIHVPVGGTSVHLVLNGLCGVVLGPVAFLAILLGLFLQFLLFSHGGLSSLGFNGCAMGLSAVAAWAGFRLWRRLPWLRSPGAEGTGAFVAGGGAVLLANGMVALGLALSGKTLATVGQVAFLAHVPIAVIEGIVTMGTVRFLRRVEPKLLGG
jgi:cobalt/nickel transport system permease protein